MKVADKAGLLRALSTISLLAITTHALIIHTLGGELEYWEVILIELLWIPILLSSNSKCKRGLLVLFMAFSGYFLPRLLNLVPWSYLEPLFKPDIFFNDAIFQIIGIKAKMVFTNYGPFIRVENIGLVGYLVGCSSLRAIPMLLAMLVPLTTSISRKLLAAITSILLVYPLNALRVALIIKASEIFSLDLMTSHILLSPLLSIITISLIMWIEDIIVKGELINEIENGFDCLLSFLNLRL
ncbi:hypothetical protein EYM_07915 [Ignicoccus islandicus DSM 13165]|uniref:Exosortase n=1 Tax=Ignicoccus islandicus DSM 13165 TaxID=940295 RepID=A0A0U3FTM3_9CREN|nr:hypothetical protein [Ignicoccus islandicus]ALU12832.1 hypothetical protein EYM_07915 [Ignicoccus islandicus DSM 13165]